MALLTAAVLLARRAGAATSAAPATPLLERPITHSSLAIGVAALIFVTRGVLEAQRRRRTRPAKFTAIKT